jgi:hypothetical protein
LLGAHRTARLGAFAARLNALVHVTDGFTRLRAVLADVGAFGANMSVVRRAAQHEIGAGLADLSAVHHQTEMGRLNVLTARFQTMRRRHLQTGFVAVETIFDALLHLAVHLLHWFSPPFEVRVLIKAACKYLRISCG